MQLFIRQIKIIHNQIQIKEIGWIHQMIHVLRANIGYQFQIQNNNFRYLVEITDIQSNQIICQIVSSITKQINLNNFGICIAMLNKFSKMELIVQKLTEIGVSEIIFRTATYSVIREISPNKIKRLNQIILEAAEQSKSWTVPQLVIYNNFNKFLAFLNNKQIIIFNQNNNNKFEKLNVNNTYGLIGPEGGFTNLEIEKFLQISAYQVSLGENILRSETAAIIGGRYLNSK